MSNYYLAVDIGASSGRHILGSLQNGKIVLEEMYRFENKLVEKNGHLCWDLAHLYREIVAGMKACKAAGKVPSSMGIDTWAVDFVLLDWTRRLRKKFRFRIFMAEPGFKSRYSTPFTSLWRSKRNIPNIWNRQSRF